MFRDVVGPVLRVVSSRDSSALVAFKDSIAVAQGTDRLWKICFASASRRLFGILGSGLSGLVVLSW